MNSINTYSGSLPSSKSHSCRTRKAINKAKNNIINQEQLLRLAEPLKKTQYGEYLLKIAEEK